MATQTGTTPAVAGQSAGAQAQGTTPGAVHSPKPITRWQTILMTAKILGITTGILLLLWLLDTAKT
jgi:hypothetical protein